MSENNQKQDLKLINENSLDDTIENKFNKLILEKKWMDNEGFKSIYGKVEKLAKQNKTKKLSFMKNVLSLNSQGVNVPEFIKNQRQLLNKKSKFRINTEKGMEQLSKFKEIIEKETDINKQKRLYDSMSRWHKLLAVNVISMEECEKQLEELQEDIRKEKNDDKRSELLKELNFLYDAVTDAVDSISNGIATILSFDIDSFVKNNLDQNRRSLFWGNVFSHTETYPKLSFLLMDGALKVFKIQVAKGLNPKFFHDVNLIPLLYLGDDNLGELDLNELLEDEKFLRAVDSILTKRETIWKKICKYSEGKEVSAENFRDFFNTDDEFKDVKLGNELGVFWAVSKHLFDLSESCDIRFRFLAEFNGVELGSNAFSDYVHGIKYINFLKGLYHLDKNKGSKLICKVFDSLPTNDIKTIEKFVKDFKNEVPDLVKSNKYVHRKAHKELYKVFEEFRISIDRDAEEIGKKQIALYKKYWGIKNGIISGSDKKAFEAIKSAVKDWVGFEHVKAKLIELFELAKKDIAKCSPMKSEELYMFEKFCSMIPDKKFDFLKDNNLSNELNDLINKYRKYFEDERKDKLNKLLKLALTKGKESNAEVNFFRVLTNLKAEDKNNESIVNSYVERYENHYKNQAKANEFIQKYTWHSSGEGKNNCFMNCCRHFSSKLAKKSADEVRKVLCNQKSSVESAYAKIGFKEMKFKNCFGDMSQPGTAFESQGGILLLSTIPLDSHTNDPNAGNEPKPKPVVCLELGDKSNNGLVMIAKEGMIVESYNPCTKNKNALKQSLEDALNKDAVFIVRAPGHFQPVRFSATTGKLKEQFIEDVLEINSTKLEKDLSIGFSQDNLYIGDKLTKPEIMMIAEKSGIAINDPSKAGIYVFFDPSKAGIYVFFDPSKAGIYVFFAGTGLSSCCFVLTALESKGTFKIVGKILDISKDQLCNLAKGFGIAAGVCLILAVVSVLVYKKVSKNRNNALKLAESELKKVNTNTDNNINYDKNKKYEVKLNGKNEKAFEVKTI